MRFELQEEKNSKPKESKGTKWKSNRVAHEMRNNKQKAKENPIKLINRIMEFSKPSVGYTRRFISTRANETETKNIVIFSHILSTAARVYTTTHIQVFVVIFSVLSHYFWNAV